MLCSVASDFGVCTTQINAGAVRSTSGLHRISTGGTVCLNSEGRVARPIERYPFYQTLGVRI